MCLAIPARVMRVNGDKAQVDFGEAKVGDYVLVHAGYAIQTVDRTDALETIALWNEILAAQKE
jgi:hydrogenase expression/formation protein HypC